VVDFFTRQEHSRRTTRVLVALFALAVLATVLAVTLAAALLLGTYTGNTGYLDGSTPLAIAAREHLGVLLAIAAGTLAFITAASLYRVSTLAGGGGEVARMLGGREIAPDSSDLSERRLMNVVEEIAIAAGVPVPTVFVLEQEPGINAFAAGLTPADAAIAVTRGALERLDRAELQGVIAHEFSHVLNGDMRLNSQLMGLAFGILALALLGRWLLRTQRYMRRRGNGVLVLFGIALVVIGSIGLLSSRLIKAAVSRQRESLADASAVQFTRDTAGLAGALKKIGGYTGRLQSVDSEEVAHMLFVRGAAAFRGLFATHPPLIERIRALDPSFDPADYPRADDPLPQARGPDTPRVAALAAGAPSMSRSEILGRTGQIGPAAVGGALLAALPEELRHAARSREQSFLLVLALALGREGPDRERRRQLLVTQIGAQRAGICARLRDSLDVLDERLHLPLLELALPAVRQRPAEQLEYLHELTERLVRLNGEPRLFDHLLLRLLTTYLRALPHVRLTTTQPPQQPLASAVVTLLATVAAFGHDDPTAARAAFDAGLATLGPRGRDIAAPSFTPLAAARDLTGLDAALASLTRLRGQAKRRLLAAVLAAIRHDGEIELAEQELYRVIAATLGAPLPPNALLGMDRDTGLSLP
jgi:Zn-dependent protease with chaperone function